MILPGVYSQASFDLDYIKLDSPVEVESAEMFKDGGTISVTLKDRHEKTFLFCLDGRLKTRTFWDDLMGKKIVGRHIYIGALYPTEPDAQEVPIHGEIEKMIYRVLQEWKGQLSLQELHERKVELVSTIISVLENR